MWDKVWLRKWLQVPSQSDHDIVRSEVQRQGANLKWAEHSIDEQIDVLRGQIMILRSIVNRLALKDAKDDARDIP